ncbi:pyridoxamine 5'-phosphate oxidase [Aliidiomarina minuta]|uniref:Pyridoxine/pyridoxamine 5'-phosphate oxidase n=1 Tax=Aliidiomarina minuta TaxID=880057 RepID=A0A432W508_9GAMM|nr:pyridoxamine 5'-phosphate oxidase [Aliidiomarina minuta]RUO24497.1 pyridoxamine 5'-phosphate oxidase [Aliidiomarina minuta]
MKIDDIRREYQLQKLQRKQLSDDPVLQFESWLNQAKLAELSADPTAMVVATADVQGKVSQRVVLLKAFDEQGFVFYTNLNSKKAQQIETNANCSLHFAWLPLERQITIEGKAEYLSEEHNQAYFHSRPRSSQIAAWASAQSQPVADRQALDAQYQAREEEFANMDTIPLPPFWGGILIRPEYIEFWQGRASRLHDRFAYQLDSERNWNIQRLQP